MVEEAEEEGKNVYNGMEFGKVASKVIVQKNSNDILSLER